MKQLDEAENHMNLAKKYLQEGIESLKTVRGKTLTPSNEGN